MQVTIMCNLHLVGSVHSCSEEIQCVHLATSSRVQEVQAEGSRRGEVIEVDIGEVKRQLIVYGEHS